MFFLYINLEPGCTILKNKNITRHIIGPLEPNVTRSTYLLQLVNKEENDKEEVEKEEWKVLMKEALVARNRLNMLIKDILGQQKASYLQDAFIYEYKLANLVYMNILIAENKDITDMFGNIKYYSEENFTGIQEDPLIKDTYIGSYGRVTNYQQDIVQYVNALNNKELEMTRPLQDLETAK
jgi:hypothetical protein